MPEEEGTPTFAAGDRVVLGYVARAPPGQRYQIIDFRRGRTLLPLGVLSRSVRSSAGRAAGAAAEGRGGGVASAAHPPTTHPITSLAALHDVPGAPQ